MSSFKKLVRIKNNSKKKMNWGLLPGFFIVSLPETFISCSEYGCRSSCWCNQGDHPLPLLGLARGRRACPLHCTCFWCPAQSSFRNDWDFYITSRQKLHLSTLGEKLLKEYLVGLRWANSDSWEAARWFRHNNREHSAFGAFQIKNSNKKPSPNTDPRWKLSLAFMEGKTSFHYFFKHHELLK